MSSRSLRTSAMNHTAHGVSTLGNGPIGSLTPVTVAQLSPHCAPCDRDRDVPCARSRQSAWTRQSRQRAHGAPPCGSSRRDDHGQRDRGTAHAARRPDDPLLRHAAATRFGRGGPFAPASPRAVRPLPSAAVGQPRRPRPRRGNGRCRATPPTQHPHACSAVSTPASPTHVGPVIVVPSDGTVPSVPSRPTTR